LIERVFFTWNFIFGFALFAEYGLFGVFIVFNFSVDLVEMAIDFLVDDGIDVVGAFGGLDGTCFFKVIEIG